MAITEAPPFLEPDAPTGPPQAPPSPPTPPQTIRATPPRARRPLPPEVLAESRAADAADAASQPLSGPVGVERSVTDEEVARILAESERYKREREAAASRPAVPPASPAPPTPPAPAVADPLDLLAPGDRDDPAAKEAREEQNERVAAALREISGGKPGRVTREESEHRRAMRASILVERAANRRLTLGLATVRAKRAMTQLELARAAGVNSLTVSRLENLHHPPTMSTARRIAAALRVDPTQLFESNPAVEPIPVPPPPAPPGPLARLLMGS